MTKILRDVPQHEGMTVADRLKKARQDADKTRKAVFDGTGIPVSTLEKYESGNMDPNTTRLQAICDFLGVSVNSILTGDDTPHVTATEETAQTKVSAIISETSTKAIAEDVPGHSENGSQAMDSNHMELVRGMLAVMEGFRTRGFGGFQRQVMALENEIRGALKFFDPNDLTMLAFEQGLYEDENYLDASIIQSLFTEDLDKGQSYCGNIEERIIDTVIFGIDFFSLEIAPLHAVANDVPDNIDLEKPDEWTWGWSDEHDVFIPYVRTAFRVMAFSGNAIDFRDEETFPKREVMVEQDEDIKNEVDAGVGFL